MMVPTEAGDGCAPTTSVPRGRVSLGAVCPWRQAAGLEASVLKGVWAPTGGTKSPDWETGGKEARAGRAGCRILESGTTKLLVNGGSPSLG